ncbi:MAG: hypothetical protein H0W15_01010 [Gemmatimonadales bacterium]|nr:hypothetical protein [Gemmatimonadales bacterium]
MGPAVHLLTLATLLGHPPAGRADTNTYADRATRELVARAMLRHRLQDTTVQSYSATLRYRLSFGVGKRRWADVPPVAAEEQEGRLVWALPNDLRVDLDGRRSASRIEGVNLTSSFGRPWFVPRTLGDSIRVFGSEAPERAAPHPLAPDADQFYRYAAGDSVTIATAGRRVTIRGVTVTPKQVRGAFVTGTLWLDVSSGDVTRFTFRFVGTDLWATPEGATSRDSAKARRESGLVSRIVQLDADLEYGLQDNAHWMPYRQVLSGRITIPFGVDAVVPFEARTTFDDYVINRGTQVVFDAPFPDSTRRGAATRESRDALRDSLRNERRSDTPDSLRPRNRTGYLANGGRYQIHRAPADSLRDYAEWGDSLTLGDTDADRDRLRRAFADLARMADALPGEMTGRPGAGLIWTRIPDLIRYNRVQGTTLGATARISVPISFTEARATVRYGLADERVMARVAGVRDAPSGRTTVAAYRDLVDLDPFARGLTLGNSLRGILVGRDAGDYALAHGVRWTHETALSSGRELTIGALVEHHERVTSSARAALPRVVGSDGFFPANPAVREGPAIGATFRLDHRRYGPSWSLIGDALSVTGEAGVRAAIDVHLPKVVTNMLSADVRVGASSTDVIPQLGFAVGGIHTVRGYEHGTSRGDAMWAVQLEASRPGRRAFTPFVFVDAGQAGRLADFSAAPFLAGAGAGVSIVGGLVRAELSQPLRNAPRQGPRFDLVFGSPL